MHSALERSISRAVRQRWGYIDQAIDTADLSGTGSNITIAPTGFTDQSFAYVIGRVDSGSAITESDETNNDTHAVKVWVGDFYTGGADLISYEVDITTDGGTDIADTTLFWGDEITLSATVANVGDTAVDGTSTPFGMRFYLSADNVLDGGDTELTSANLTVSTLLNNGEMVTMNGSTPVSLPEPTSVSGTTYYIIMDIDASNGTGTITEVNDEGAGTNNNQVAVPITVYRTDLGLQNTNFVDPTDNSTPRSLDWGDQVQIMFDIANYGPNSLGSGTATVDIFVDLNGNGVYDSGEGEQQTIDFSSTPLNVNQTMQKDVTLTLPSSGTDGDFEIIAKISGIEESYTANNTVSLELPVGDMDSISGIDLIGVQAAIPVNTDLVWGGSVDVPVVIMNQGGTNLTADFEMQAYFSMDMQLDSDDIALGSAVTVTDDIAADGFSVQAVTVTLPSLSAAQAVYGTSASSSSYVLIFKIDSATTPAVTETYRSNNVLVSDVLTSLVSSSTPVTGADLAGQHLVVPALSRRSLLVWGSTVDVYANFSNIGDTTYTDGTGMEVAYYLSPTSSLPADPSSDPGILALTPTSAQTPVTSLASGVATNAAMTAVTLTVPAMPTNPANQYYLIARAATPSDDADPTNNDIILMDNTGSSMQIQVQSADLMPDVEDYDTEFSVVWKFGNTYTLAVDALNVSSVDVDTSFTIDVYLTPIEPALDSIMISDLSDTTVFYPLTATSVTVTSLAGQESSVNDVNVTLPADASGFTTTATNDTYYLLYVVDSGEAITEMSEDNNMDWVEVVISATAGTGQDVEMLDGEFDLESVSDEQLSQLQWNQTYTEAGMFDIYNAGGAINIDFDVTFKLSTDRTWDTGDTDFAASSGTYTVPGATTAFASKGILGVDLDLQTPASGTDGLYYVIARADAGGALTSETNTDDNDSDVTPVFVGSWLTGGSDVLVLDGELEMGAADGSISTATTYGVNDYVKFDFEMVNIGATAVSGDFEAQFYIAKSGDDTNKQLLTSYTIPTDGSNPQAMSTWFHNNASTPMTSGRILTYANQVLIPEIAANNMSSTGEYEIIIELNSGTTTITELTGGDTNNTYTIPIELDIADMSFDTSNTVMPGGAGSLWASPVDVVWGESVEMEVVVASGTSSDLLDVGLTAILDADGDLSTTTDQTALTLLDDNDATLTTIDLLDGQDWEGNLAVTLPSTAPTGWSNGTSVIALILDSGDAVFEQDETNNSLSQALTITDSASRTFGGSGTADLVLIESMVDWHDDSGGTYWGSWVPMSITVYNDGDTAAGAFNITLSYCTGTYDATSVINGTAAYKVVDYETLNSVTPATGQTVTDGSSIVVSDLQPGELLEIEAIVKLPDYSTSIASKTSLIAMIDSDPDASEDGGTGKGDVDEGSLETNNEADVDTLTFASATDLLAGKLSVDTSLSGLNPGETITVTAGVVNPTQYGDNAVIQYHSDQFLFVAQSIGRTGAEWGSNIDIHPAVFVDFHCGRYGIDPAGCSDVARQYVGGHLLSGHGG